MRVTIDVKHVRGEVGGYARDEVYEDRLFYPDRHGDFKIRSSGVRQRTHERPRLPLRFGEDEQVRCLHFTVEHGANPVAGVENVEGVYGGACTEPCDEPDRKNKRPEPVRTSRPLSHVDLLGKRMIKVHRQLIPRRAALRPNTPTRLVGWPTDHAR